MNVQGANVLSLLSGSENVGNLQQGVLGANDAKAGFASALMEQLGLLQSGLGGDANLASPDLAAIQDWVKAAKSGNGQSDLQSFAALFGNNLPPGSAKISQDIDLEDTLQTLAGVLQQLQQLEAGANVDIPNTGTQQVLATQLDQAELDQTELDAEAMANAAAFMPVAVPQSELNTTTEQAADEAGLSLLATKKQAAVSLVARDQNAQLESAAGGTDELGLDFNRGISGMLAKEGADGKSQQDKNNLGFKAESLLSQIESQADGADAGKTLPGVAADIAKLNQAMRSDGSPVPAAQSEMGKHFADPAWNKELGEKLIWMHKQSIPSVELRLNPEHLGPVLVKIDVSHDQASVAFTAQHAAVKEAIESAIPKLREMLNGQQLNLVDVNVSQQQSDQRQPAREFFQMASDQHRGHRSDPDADGSATANAAQNLVDEIEAGRAVASNGLLSLFA